MSQPKKLYRSKSDRMLLGVCGGLADYLGIDPVVVRLLWTLVTLFSFGLGGVGYIAAAIIVPEEP